MTILVTLTFLLIAGTSRFSIAYQGVSSAHWEHLKTLGFVNTTIEDIEEFDRALCRRNGGPTTYDDHKKSLGHFDRCKASLWSEIQQEIIMAINSGPPLQNLEVVYFHGFCRMVLNFGSCIKNLTDSVKTCLDVEKHESADIVYNAYISTMGFVCEANSETSISKFVSFFECAESNHPALVQCVNQTFSKYVHATVSNGAAVGGLGALHLLVPDVNKCTLLEKFQLCTVEVLANCTPSMSTVDITNSLFNIVKKVTTCDHLLKSDASPSRVVNIALITAATAMSLRFIYK